MGGAFGEDGEPLPRVEHGHVGREHGAAASEVADAALVAGEQWCAYSVLGSVITEQADPHMHAQIEELHNFCVVCGLVDSVQSDRPRTSTPSTHAQPHGD